MVGRLCYALIFVVSGCVTVAEQDSAKSRLCTAFYSLASDVQTTGEIQSVTLFKERPMEIACSFEEGDTVQHAYCNAILSGGVSREFTHAYPWTLRKCLIRRGDTPKIETSKEYTGLVDRDKIINLSAVLSTGIQVELAFEASEEQTIDSPHGRYWGRYVLVLSKN